MKKYRPGPNIWDIVNVGTRSKKGEPKRTLAKKENEDKSAKQSFASKKEASLRAFTFDTLWISQMLGLCPKMTANQLKISIILGY